MAYHYHYYSVGRIDNKAQNTVDAQAPPQHHQGGSSEAPRKHVGRLSHYHRQLSPLHPSWINSYERTNQRTPSNQWLLLSSLSTADNCAWELMQLQLVHSLTVVESSQYSISPVSTSILFSDPIGFSQKANLLNLHRFHRAICDASRKYGTGQMVCPSVVLITAVECRWVRSPLGMQRDGRTKDSVCLPYQVSSIIFLQSIPRFRCVTAIRHRNLACIVNEDDGIHHLYGDDWRGWLDCGGWFKRTCWVARMTWHAIERTLSHIINTSLIYWLATEAIWEKFLLSSRIGWTIALLFRT